jgi:acyl dehydratase
MTFRYFEDFVAGDTLEIGSYTVARDEILAFAQQFDPQPFHVDEEKAKASLYGGLIASGWHTASILMRLLVDGILNDSASMGSPGIDELRWLRPVRPGDTLRARFTVREALPSTRHANRGTVVSTCELFNQADEVVVRVTGRNIIGRRPAEGAE